LEDSSDKQFRRPPTPKINQNKMDWRCGSYGRVAVLQVQSPEFKLQSHQKKKKGSKFIFIFSTPGLGEVKK
jgi:hypothetical protein